MNVAVVLDDLYGKHETGIGHPESPDRYRAIADTLLNFPKLKARDATVDEIALCHSRDYIELVKRECAEGRQILSTGDVVLCPLSFQVALRAAGGAIAAVDAVLNGDYLRTFAAVRPPGHHAESNRGMGFCLFNNVAIAARYAKLKRVLIVDWDVHHGNGTQEIFYDDPSVFYFSTHQWPLYPGTGKASETGGGTTFNAPIIASPDSTKHIYSAFDELEEKMEEYKPELILISAGFDAHRFDPIGGLMLHEGDYRDLTKRLVNLSERYCSGKIVSILEGGYNIDALKASIVSHINAMN